MKRALISIVVTVIILIGGGLLIWRFIIAPRLAIPVVSTSPTSSATGTKEAERHAALTLYLAAPSALPNGAVRAELSLTKATISGPDRQDVPVFDGRQSVMLQAGSVEEALSELVPEGHWNRLTLSFSPAAQLAYADGRLEATLLERRETVLSFDARLPQSGTLALFARVPIETDAPDVGGARTANLAADPQATEWFIFGGFMLDPRGRGDLWNVAEPSLSGVIKADLGFDITAKTSGSSGFVPATDQPATQTPQ